MSGFLKSPFNYIGGKHRLLSQILPLLPKRMGSFVDVMGGGFNVGLNVHARHYVYNDMVSPLVDLWKYFYSHGSDEILCYIGDRINEYSLSRDDKDSFYNFREYYNGSSCRHPLDLYVLMCYSYNYQLRFNNGGFYNSSHGTNRSCFTSSLRGRLLGALDRLHGMSVSFYCLDFMDLVNLLMERGFCGSDSLFYFDPPYLISTGNYNDGNRGFKNWETSDDRRLYKTLKRLDENNINFALSNIITHRGRENKLLLKFIEHNNYMVHEIRSNYNNCSYNSGKTLTKEVLITNYI